MRDLIQGENLDCYSYLSGSRMDTNDFRLESHVSSALAPTTGTGRRVQR